MEKVLHVDKEQSESDFAEEVLEILKNAGYARERIARQASNCPGTCTPASEEVLAEQFNRGNPYSRCLNLVKINVTLNGSTADSVYMGIGSTFESRCVNLQDSVDPVNECFSEQGSQCEQTRKVVDLNEVYSSRIFPRYIIDLDCKGTGGDCRPVPQTATVSVLKQTCNEDGTAVYVVMRHTLTLSCNCYK